MVGRLYVVRTGMLSLWLHLVLCVGRHVGVVSSRLLHIRCMLYLTMRTERPVVVGPGTRTVYLAIAMMVMVPVDSTSVGSLARRLHLTVAMSHHMPIGIYVRRLALLFHLPVHTHMILAGVLIGGVIDLGHVSVRLQGLLVIVMVIMSFRLILALDAYFVLAILPVDIVAQAVLLFAAGRQPPLVL